MEYMYSQGIRVHEAKLRLMRIAWKYLLVPERSTITGTSLGINQLRMRTYSLVN